MTSTLSRLFELDAMARREQWEDAWSRLDGLDLSVINVLQAKYVARPVVAFGRTTGDWSKATQASQAGSSDLRKEIAREIGRVFRDLPDAPNRDQVFRLLASLLHDPNQEVVGAALLVFNNHARKDDFEIAGVTAATIIPIADSEDQWTAFQAAVALMRFFGNYAESAAVARKTMEHITQTTQNGTLRDAAREFLNQELPA